MRLVGVEELDAAQVGALRAIYLDAFPPQERAPFETLMSDRVLALVDDERPVGLAVLRNLGGTGWVFLRYLAVGERGRGVGGELWRLVCEAHPRHTRIVLDVEDPDDRTIGAADRSIRERRIEFYRRLGADLPAVGAYEPPHDGVPLPMRLMVADLRTGQTPPVVGADLRQVVEMVYLHRYGLGPHTAEVRRILAASQLEG